MFKRENSADSEGNACSRHWLTNLIFGGTSHDRRRAHVGTGVLSAHLKPVGNGVRIVPGVVLCVRLQDDGTLPPRIVQVAEWISSDNVVATAMVAYVGKGWQAAG